MNHHQHHHDDNFYEGDRSGEWRPPASAPLAPIPPPRQAGHCYQVLQKTAILSQKKQTICSKNAQIYSTQTGWPLLSGPAKNCNFANKKMRNFLNFFSQFPEKNATFSESKGIKHHIRPTFWFNIIKMQKKTINQTPNATQISSNSVVLRKV